MRIPQTIRLTVLLLCLGFITSQVSAQNASCFFPGTLVVTDSPDTTIIPFHDIEKVYISEPYSNDGSPKMGFTLKVRSLHTDIPLAPLPVASWNVIWTPTSGPTRYVRMDTLLTNPVLTYGTVTNLLGIPNYIATGGVFGTYADDGTIRFTVDKSAVGNPTVGSVMSVTSKTYVSTLNLGLVEIDSTAATNYTVLGNAGCSPFQIVPFGNNGDIAVTNDYNRNGTNDFSVWRPSTGTWFSQDSVTGAYRQTQHGSGPLGDIPIAGHFDNDIQGDATVYRPSTGEWLVRNTETGALKVTQFGVEEDIPAPGDFDGDQIDDLAVFRPSTGTWYVLSSFDSSVRIMRFGLQQDRPVVGDYDGDRRADIAVFRPSVGNWYYVRSSDNTAVALHWGAGTDQAVQADYDGDGKTDVAVWRPETGVWYIYKSFNGSIEYAAWGLSTDRVQPGDFNGNGRSDLAVWRPETGVWYVNYR